MKVTGVNRGSERQQAEREQSVDMAAETRRQYNNCFNQGHFSYPTTHIKEVSKLEDYVCVPIQGLDLGLGNMAKNDNDKNISYHSI